MKILVINPGSTSTKLSLYEDRTELFSESLFHDAPVLLSFPTVNEQVPFRKKYILDTLIKRGVSPENIDVFIGRGGSAWPQPAGILEIDERLYQDTAEAVGGSEHPAKLGVMLAFELCREYGGKMYTMNATNVDELCDEARLTGIMGVYRNAQSHVLNQKTVANHYAESIGKNYEDLNLIVCHIDGGITVNAHEKGRMIDGNVGSGGDGAFSPSRTGSVPVLPLLDYIDAHSTEEVRRMCSRSGGFVSFFGTQDADAIHRLLEAGDPKARLVWKAMIYTVCKQIGAMAAVLEGRIDRILLTGGLVRFNDIVETIKKKCGWIADISVFPGEMEQEALAEAAYLAASGNIEVRSYTGKPVFIGFPFMDGYAFASEKI